MGCKPSKLQIQHNGDLFNEDTDVRKRFLTGLQVSKGSDGIEGNLQIAFATARHKKYERVTTVSGTETELQEPDPIEIPAIEFSDMENKDDV